MSQEVLQDGSPVAKKTHDEETYEAFVLRTQNETDANSEELTQPSGLEIVRKKLEKLLTTKTVEKVIKVFVIGLVTNGLFSLITLGALIALINEGCTAEENTARVIIAMIIAIFGNTSLFALSNWVLTHTDDK